LPAACRCAEIPALGALGRRHAASLLGLAPYDRDSGRRLGGRRIRGGRTHPRRVLYMAALSAIRWEPGSQGRYQRLTARGKPHKVAMVAVMRRLACLLNTLLREDRLWQAEPPCTALQVAA
ncbi:MAG: transposase, partial [Bryobacterales bacterium]|nr:transposase [Bryobacterales bacterium]